MPPIHILADDLTGALDSAAAFSGEIPVFLDRPAPGYDHAPVAVLASATRDVPQERLATHLQPVLGWFSSGGVAFKKVDSLLRGNTFAEIAWLCREGGFGRVIFAPAFPAQGRITVDDRQWVVRSDRTRQAVAEPLREAFGRFGLSVAESPDEVGTVWIPEVATDADLDRVVARGGVTEGKKILWCGSAGLAHALARTDGRSPGTTGAMPPAKEGGPTVLISASFQPVFREQWAALRAGVPDGVAAEQGDDHAIDEALRAAGAGAAQVWFDLSPRREMTMETAIRLLAGHVKHLVERLPRPGQLLVVGGDTLLGLCRETGTELLLTQASVRNGWGCARLVGGRWDGVPCHSRSGAFGGREDLLRMVERVSGSGKESR